MSKVTDTASHNPQVAPGEPPADRIESAAMWLSATGEPPRPLVPYLRRAFGLSAAEAIRVIRRAHVLRGVP